MEKLNEIEPALEAVRRLQAEFARADEQYRKANSDRTVFVNQLSDGVRALAKAVAAGMKQLSHEHRQTFEQELLIQLKSN